MEFRLQSKFSINEVLETGVAYGLNSSSIAVLKKSNDVKQIATAIMKLATTNVSMQLVEMEIGTRPKFDVASVAEQVLATIVSAKLDAKLNLNGADQLQIAERSAINTVVNTAIGSVVAHTPINAEVFAANAIGSVASDELTAKINESNIAKEVEVQEKAATKSSQHANYETQKATARANTNNNAKPKLATHYTLFKPKVPAQGEVRKPVAKNSLNYFEYLKEDANEDWQDAETLSYQFKKDPIGFIENVGDAINQSLDNVVQFVARNKGSFTLLGAIYASNEINDEIANTKTFLHANWQEKQSIAARATVNDVELIGSILVGDGIGRVVSTGLRATSIVSKNMSARLFATTKTASNVVKETETSLSLSSAERNFYSNAQLISEHNFYNTGNVPARFKNTFLGSRYKTYLLTKDTIFYRGGSREQGFGQFFSFDKPISELQVRMDKAVRPLWPDGGKSIVDTGHAIKIPRGTMVHIGDVSPQGGIFVGGTKQIFVDRPWLIPGAEVVNSYALKEEVLWNQILIRK